MTDRDKSRTEFWKNELALFSRRDMTAQAFCQERGLGYSTFCSWRRRLREISRGGAATLAIPVLAPPPVLAAPELQSGAVEPGQLRIDSAGASIWLAASTPAGRIAELIHALARVGGGSC